VIISEPIFRQSDKDRIIEQLSNLEYAKAPDVYFESDQFKINEIIRKYDDISLFIGSSNDREEALHMDTWFSELTFPITSKFIFNKTIVGYKGSLTLIEELFSNL
jgi:nitrogenase molybdenum-iron protein beta chain